jgi:predicted SnoaL-like aldol condensation-catalyzing enzyme
MGNLQKRSAQEVFDDHLREGKSGSVEEDFARNYAEDVVLLTGRGVYRGRNGLMHLAELLRKELPDAQFEYVTRTVEGDVAFLEWTARADGAQVEDGSDTFVIRDGRIVAQTIHYTVERSGQADPEES